MSERYVPMLARDADAPFSSPDWLFEIKWDGIRAICFIGPHGEFGLSSRNGRDLSGVFPEIGEITGLAPESSVLDGEVVAMREGRPDFQSLLQRAQKTSPEDIAALSRVLPVTYIVFDLLECRGKSLIALPLTRRKELLAREVREGPHVVLSRPVDTKGKEYFEVVSGEGIEGIIAKKKTSVYEPGIRSDNWLKIKNILTCDCVVLGYTPGQGERRSTFGALILGLYDHGSPVYIGKVGTGFSIEEREEILQELNDYGPGSPLPGAGPGVWWVGAGMVCEVAYTAVTRGGMLRAPRFIRRRPDKRPEECGLDQLEKRNAQMELDDYRKKRNFDETPEPGGEIGKTKAGHPRFVVQEHYASTHHFDLRLERDGVLKSWAVPKGIPEKTGIRNLAIRTEDHPLEYADFEGTIPRGQYGAGEVGIWDRGFYEPLEWNEDKIEVVMKGERISGLFVLVRFRKAGENDWLLLKGKD
ncbi:DNA ligase D-like protein (predicted ligase)/DNA ligase D-like protein (predicted 3'-phosphoesterase) [Methanolinea mesophila]|uniref:non-homologous end-joining DNA ligase n=1 Tax=Methanolinea mesophila TaxID=547055 RepID=UPI001AE3F755|nr:non-homologous end-joining DNA ligase [Methanolinea mesophila]MBP1927975.1 DNA ligase D-like protein (predicted ligase)/DNA ligase D-like protein (predicted 3'-phosphoesterase) [Methanolinea mesophila]